MKSISSDTRLSEIDQHIKIFAGPGSGKTFWMVGHIKDILHRSEKLSKTRKIACITYTNIGVETVLGRLGTAVERVEVSTIHSFLYQNIVQPYISFLADDYALKIDKIDGYQDPYVSYSCVSNWIKNHPEKEKLKHPFSEKQLLNLPVNTKALSNWLESISFALDSTFKLYPQCLEKKAFAISSDGKRTNIRKACLKILEKDLMSYKEKYWEKGILFHEDILFFSYELIKRFPFILQILSAKYPYIFIDEFQDTNPIQAAIINEIGKTEAIVGVIGDQAQSIYAFQGAGPDVFNNFSLSGMKSYQIKTNRRCSKKIINILNTIRFDIEQESYGNKSNFQPAIIVGEKVLSLREAQRQCVDGDIQSLYRDNITSNAMKRENSETELNDRLLDELSEIDKPSKQNKYRSRVMRIFIESLVLAHENKFKDSIKTLGKIFSREVEENQKKRVALSYIKKLLTKYDEITNGTLYQFFLFIKEDLKVEISQLASGKKPREFYEKYKFHELALCVKVAEDTSAHKTIHKAKGDEFENVLLILKDEKNLDFLWNPDLVENEEHRINYVAISRAKSQLFISVPALSEENEKLLVDRFEIQRL